MAEQATIEKTRDQSVTVELFKKDLLVLDVKPDTVLLFHSSLSSLG
jgi:aminoglycoside N3'-acetyltransferase